MDVGAEYIKMCEKADEIQTKTQPVHIMESREVFVYDGDEIWFHYAVGEGKGMVIRKVWLPRQDQLQEMLEWAKKGTYGVLLIDAFYNWSKKTFNPQPFGNDSMSWEQLWLAFVMKEKYNKTWSGEEWVTKAPAP